MGERMWVSNLGIDDISGGAEVLGTEFCKAMKLKYMSARKFGVNTSPDIDIRLKDVSLDLLVYNSTNCATAKPDAKRSIAVCCENFKKESVCLGVEEFRKMKLLEWEFQQKSLRNADKIVTISKGEHDSFLSDGFKSTMIEPYVDLDSFYPKTTEKYPKKTALFIGRAHNRKGYDIVLELHKLHPEITFMIHTGGFLTTDALNDMYNVADFLIMPSRYESFGFIYAEALATNLPIISSRVGVFETWQPEDHGIFPEEISVESFSKTINEFGKREFQKSRGLAEKRFSYDRFKGECDDLLNNW